MNLQSSNEKICFTSSENLICLNPKLDPATLKVLETICQHVQQNQGMLLVPTSGSTGIPKIVAIKKSAFLESAKAVNKFVHATKEDIWLNPLPLFHVGGLSIKARAFLSKSHEVQFFTWEPKQFHQILEKEKITLTSLVPTQLYDLVQAKLSSPASLRAIFIGGGKLDRELAKEALALGWPIIMSFGMSETSAMIAARKIESSDFSQDSFYTIDLLPGVKIKTTNERLCIHSTGLFEGYYSLENNVVQFQDPKSGGWFLTEDFAEVTATTLTPQGRASNQVKIRGELVNIDWLESTLKAQLKIDQHHRIAIIPIPDERAENKLILASEIPIPKHLLVTINQGLPPFARIEEIFLLQELPKSSLGKILKMNIKEQYMNMPQSQTSLQRDVIELTKTTRGNLEVLEIKRGENCFRFTPFGGQLIGWEKQGIPILFENQDSAITDGKTAYRGGAPICAPYFGKGLSLPGAFTVEPQHGNARKSVWEYAIDQRQGTVTCTTVQPSAAGYPETNFKISLIYSFTDTPEADITIKASIENIGDNASPAQCVIHSYWQANQPENATIEGLGGNYLDNLDKLSSKVHQSPFPTKFSAPFDRVYTNPRSNITLQTEAYDLNITTTSANAAVLWRPANEHGLKDLDPSVVPPFVCVESGIVTPSPELTPGESITFKLGWKVNCL